MNLPKLTKKHIELLKELFSISEPAAYSSPYSLITNVTPGTKDFNMYKHDLSDVENALLSARKFHWIGDIHTRYTRNIFLGGSTCGFCQTPKGCTICPIYKDTGYAQCHSTPFFGTRGPKNVARQACYDMAAYLYNLADKLKFEALGKTGICNDCDQNISADHSNCFKRWNAEVRR